MHSQAKTVAAALVGVVIAIASADASAATYSFEMNVGNTIGWTHYDHGFGAYQNVTPFTVVTGDELIVDVTLDKPITMEADTLKFADVGFNSAIFQHVFGRNASTLSLYDPQVGWLSDAGFCINCLTAYAGTDRTQRLPLGALTIEKMRATFLVDMPQPVQPGQLSVSVRWRSVPEPPPVILPEPGTWTLLIGGFGMVGSALRRRQSALGSVQTGARTPRRLICRRRSWVFGSQRAMLA